MEICEEKICGEISADKNAGEQAKPAQAREAHDQPQRRGAHENDQQYLCRQSNACERPATQQHIENVGIDFHARHGKLVADGGEQPVTDFAATKSDQNSLALKLTVTVA